MRDSYTLSGWRRRFCRAAAWLFLVAAALYALGTLGGAWMIATPEATWRGLLESCCTVHYHATDLLPEANRALVTASAATARGYADWLARPDVRAALMAVILVTAVPFLLLLLFVGRALWRLSARTTHELGVALPDLRRASLAALVAVFMPALRDSGLAMLALPGVPSEAAWYVEFDAGTIGQGLLLAIAAWIVTWAIAEGSRAARALDDFV